MSNINKGPSIINIPQRSFLSCSGCEFYKSKLIVSGRNPKYAHSCTHLDAKRLTLDLYYGNLSANEMGYVETPNWCPLKLKSNE